MTQYLRPDSDGTFTNWTGSYTSIDEESPSDADYIVGANNANGTAIVGLGNPAATPTTKTCTIRYRARKSAAAGHARQVSIQAYEGTTARGTAISSGDLSETWTEYSGSVDLTAVTDWNHLNFYIVSTGTVGTPSGSRRFVWVSYAVLETPDGAAVNIVMNVISTA